MASMSYIYGNTFRNMMSTTSRRIYQNMLRMHLSNGYTLSNEAMQSIRNTRASSCSIFCHEKKVNNRLLVTSLPSNDHDSVVLSYRHKSENLLLKEIEGMYPGEPTMNKFLNYYIKKNYSQLFDLFGKAFSAFDNIYLSQTQQNVANDVTGMTARHNGDYTNEETKYRVSFSQKQNCDFNLENNVSYTKEDISEVINNRIYCTPPPVFLKFFTWQQ